MSDVDVHVAETSPAVYVTATTWWTFFLRNAGTFAYSYRSFSTLSRDNLLSESTFMLMFLMSGSHLREMRKNDLKAYNSFVRPLRPRTFLRAPDSPGLNLLFLPFSRICHASFSFRVLLLRLICLREDEFQNQRSFFCFLVLFWVLFFTVNSDRTQKVSETTYIPLL